MVDTVYSTSKALWHIDRVAELAAGRQPYPVHVELIISDYCNMNCQFCAYRSSGYTSNELFQVEPGQSRKARNPNRTIPVKKCFEILSDCKDMGVKAIQFTGGGEPTIHPDFPAIAQYALDRGFEVGLVTNGSMLLEDDVRRVVRQMTWVRVSVDAAKIATYCWTREVTEGMWHRVEDGVQLLCSERDEQKLPLTIGIGFVVTPENWPEMLAAAHLYRIWGADNVRLGLMFSSEGAEPYAGIEQSVIRLAEQTATELSVVPGFTVVSRVAEKLRELHQGQPSFPVCWYQHFTTYIGGDLNVYRCCVYAYNWRGLVGNLREQRFKELWDSSAKKTNFARFNAHQCDRCQFTAIIQQIDNVMTGKGAPPHVNFV